MVLQHFHGGFYLYGWEEWHMLALMKGWRYCLLTTQRMHQRSTPMLFHIKASKKIQFRDIVISPNHRRDLLVWACGVFAQLSLLSLLWSSGLVLEVVLEQPWLSVKGETWSYVIMLRILTSVAPTNTALHQSKLYPPRARQILQARVKKQAARSSTSPNHQTKSQT